jgi:hypothetical protein
MQVVAAVLLIAAIVFGWRLNSLSRVVNEQRHQIQTLTAALSDKSKQEGFALQEKCAAKADNGGLWSGMEYSNHYNARLNRCFAVSEAGVPANDLHATRQPAPSVLATRQVFDVFEGRGVAMFRAYDDRPGEPLACWVEVPSGEQKTCRNESEWESLTRIYLER